MFQMPFKGKYSTDWQGLCVTDLEEPELDTKVFTLLIVNHY